MLTTALFKNFSCRIECTEAESSEIMVKASCNLRHSSGPCLKRDKRWSSSKGMCNSVRRLPSFSCFNPPESPYFIIRCATWGKNGLEELPYLIEPFNSSSAGRNPGNTAPGDVSPSFALKEHFDQLRAALSYYPPDRRRHIKCCAALLCLLC